MKNTPPQIWVLCDDRPGNSNQALGVAEALELPYAVKRIAYSPSANLPNFLSLNALSRLDAAKSDRLEAPWPDLVISAGRRAAPIARYIKSQSRGNSRIVQIMWPGFPTYGVDMIVVPEHDRVHLNRNIVRVPGAPHRLNEDILEREGKMWEKTLSEVKKPYVALLIGGSTRKRDFTPEHASEVAQMASMLAISMDASLLISTSRRTSDESERVLKRQITAPFYFHDWRKANNRMNPYIAFLALADAIVVTGDSLSMCTEACSVGKPVLIYSPKDLSAKKHQRLHKLLFDKGYALPLTPENLPRVQQGQFNPPSETLNPSLAIARRIKTLFFPVK
ncbi:MAG: nucleoside-diphosphate sugar epimerase [Proteobacteria bacterium]|nr:nucleoside-diphosphate sugar epimerase [Pseudomonadota bacterium]